MKAETKIKKYVDSKVKRFGAEFLGVLKRYERPKIVKGIKKGDYYIRCNYKKLTMTKYVYQGNGNWFKHTFKQTTKTFINEFEPRIKIIHDWE